MTPLTFKKLWWLISDTFLPYVEAKIEYDCFILIFPFGSEKFTHKNQSNWNKMEGMTAKKSRQFQPITYFLWKKLWKIKFKFLEKLPTADFKNLQE